MTDLVKELRQGHIPGSTRWKAARRIEELEAGSCRRNCSNERDIFKYGYIAGVVDGSEGYKQSPDDAYQEFKDDK